MDPNIHPQTLNEPGTSIVNPKNKIDNRIVFLVVSLVISLGANVVIGSYIFLLKKPLAEPGLTLSVQSTIKTVSPTPLNVLPTKKDYSDCFKAAPTYSGGGIEIPNTDLNGFSQKCPVYLLEADLASIKGQIVNKDQDKYLIFTDHALYIIFKGKPSFPFEEIANAARVPMYSKTFITNQTLPVMVDNQRIDTLVTISTYCKEMNDASCETNNTNNEKSLLFQLPDETDIWIQLFGSSIGAHIKNPSQWEENILRIKTLSPASTASSTSPAP